MRLLQLLLQSMWSNSFLMPSNSVRDHVTQIYPHQHNQATEFVWQQWQGNEWQTQTETRSHFLLFKNAELTLESILIYVSLNKTLYIEWSNVACITILTTNFYSNIKFQVPIYHKKIWHQYNTLTVVVVWWKLWVIPRSTSPIFPKSFKIEASNPWYLQPTSKWI